jgi:thioredoxin-like negative regulator of GroEL
MISLQTQDQLEALLRRGEYKNAQVAPLVAIYFTADWCGACRRLNLQEILAEVPEARWHICDVDENNYSAGFCGVRSIPSFMLIFNGQPSQLFTNSDTNAVIHWIRANIHQARMTGQI